MTRIRAIFSKSRSLPALVLCLLAWPALAQLSFDSSPAIANDPVKGKPFEATKLVHARRMLADGTVSTQEIELQEARDSRGRFVVESHTELSAGPNQPARATFVAVKVIDPEARTSLSWTSVSKVAQLTRLAEPPPSSGPSLPVSVGDDSSQPHMLGHRVIHGMLTTGRRTERRVPVGAMGNTTPIEITREWWTNDDLDLVVLEITSDPQRGERTTELVSLKRVEPDPERFHVPAGYSVRGVMTPVPGPAVAGPQPRNSSLPPLEQNHDH